jgi:predicted amidophosphoribosyltransferase
MAWNVRELTATFPTCPFCGSPLLESSDMWGAFYACEECGYEGEALETELEINHPQPLAEAVFASSYRPDHSPYLEGRRL